MVVASLESSMREIARDLGVRWTPMREAVLPVADASGAAEIPMRVVSSDAPMSIELIETVPGTLFETPSRGWHHVAFRTDELVADVSRLEEQGYRRELWGRTPAGDLTYFCYLVAPSGPRVELVAPRRTD